jgi:hypothetical protein
MTTFRLTPVDALDEPMRLLSSDAPSVGPLGIVLISSACIVVGLLWDISWHSTIGRDTFWSPPHLLEQFGAVVAGLSCGWLVLRTTFSKRRGVRNASVRFWGFSAPLGAWVIIWGTFVMVASAPFDNWWHNAYGLDVKIVSPPHMVLAMGMVAVEVGAMLMALAAQNRAIDPDEVRSLGWAYAIAGGILVTMIATVITEYASRPNQMHAPLFYQVASGVFPVFLAAFARSGRLRVPATTTAGIYMAIVLGMIWILQLVPAHPKLAPIFNPVTHMVPPHFPLLLIVPAFGLDLLIGRDKETRWTRTLGAGIVFVLLLLGVQWFFGEFLLSPHARNFFFGADQWPYFIEPGAWQYRFWGVPTTSSGHLNVHLFSSGLAIAGLLAFVSASIGVWWGNGMARVMR